MASLQEQGGGRDIYVSTRDTEKGEPISSVSICGQISLGLFCDRVVQLSLKVKVFSSSFLCWHWPTDQA